MSTFEQNLRTTFMESLYSLCNQHHKTDPYYQQLKAKYDRLFEDIRDRLGKHHKLMLKLEALGCEKEGIDEELIYSQGMADCVKMLKMIRMI